ncbi:MAG: hypothetical protein IH623_01540 [Verrucomicrobia bacterium]|nr:hypothetical protein [Verrucomicrobiota bacterium]
MASTTSLSASREGATSRKLRSKPSGCQLLSPGWTNHTRRTLERWIDHGAHQNLPVIFDFDNTLVAGDLQEATLAVLARDGILTASRIAETLSPPFRLPGRGRITLQASADITEYYEAFLTPTAHGERDPTPLANSYAWAIEVLAGLRVSDVVEATREVCRLSRLPAPSHIEVTPGKTRYPVPTFYPEMIELVAELLRRQFDVWIVSGTNVWSVRWMVKHELNPRLRQYGLRTGLRADHIIGVSTLLADRRDRLYKDILLVRENVRYAALNEKVLSQYRLTSRLQFPVPTYSGKVACILDALGRRPYLCLGDSPGDHSMLAFGEHRLWMARVEKPGHFQQTARLIRATGTKGWVLQPTLASGNPGFVSDLGALAKRNAGPPHEVRTAARSLSALSKRLGLS